MTRAKHLHLHRTPWWRTYSVHAPDGSLLGNVYPAGIRLPESWPRSRWSGWIAVDADLNLIAEGLESRTRAIEFVSER